MSFVIVPHACGTNTATLWLGSFDTVPLPTNLMLRIEQFSGPLQWELPANDWRRINPDQHLPLAEQVHFHQTVQVQGLQPNQQYRAFLVGTNAFARFKTLPLALPSWGQSPFTVALASCFHLEKDTPGLTGLRYMTLPPEDQPDLKILCGDQVYLDQPTWQNFPQNGPWLANRFLRTYINTWTHRGTMHQGFGSLLRQGANYFTSDDHEYWNNYPNAASVVQNSWTEAGRKQWKGIAQDLFRTFQRRDAGAAQSFDVPPVSFLLLETRYDREEGGENFIPDLQALDDWLQKLNENRWIGFLGLSQPLFEKASGWFRRSYVDRTLADYKQYTALVQLLHKRKQSVVILTGDVHFGRVTKLKSFRAPLYEIISSPCALVSSWVGGSASEPPGSYPVEAVQGIEQVGIETLRDTRGQPVLISASHFLTMSLWTNGTSVQMRLKYWPTTGESHQPLSVLEITLSRAI